jgi:hypothetical protein
LIRTNFSVTLKGYLIPEEFNNVVTTQKKLTPKRIIIGDEVVAGLTNLVGDSQTRETKITVAKAGTSAAVNLENPLTILAGTGLSITNAGQFDGDF